MRWQLESKPAWDIVAEGVVAWGVTKGTVQDYLRRCNKQWTEAFAMDRESLKIKLQSRLESLTHKLERAGEYRDAAAAVKMLADISGVTKQSMELSGPDGKPIQSESNVKVLFLPAPEDKPA